VDLSDYTAFDRIDEPLTELRRSCVRQQYESEDKMLRRIEKLTEALLKAVRTHRRKMYERLGGRDSR
jgi:hypothetical protein